MQRKKKTRKEKQIEWEKEKKKPKPFDKVKFFEGVLLFIGAILTFAAMLIFRKTFINWQIPISISLFVGILTTLFTSRFSTWNWKDHFGSTWKIWLTFNNSVVFGGFVIFSLMFINLKSPEISLETHQLKILKKSTNTGRQYKVTSADVNYKGLIKSIGFSYEEKMNLRKAKYLTLKTKRGRLGFDVILEKELSK